MIFIDGDSLAFVADDATARFKWPILIGEATGMTVHSEATHKATAAICLERAWKAIEREAKWYVLCVGQWSQNHEPLKDFQGNIRAIIELMHANSVKVVLMTPTRNIGCSAEYVDVMYKLAAVYHASLCDVHGRTSELPRDDPFFTNDGFVRCHPSSDGHRKICDWLLEDVAWS